MVSQPADAHTFDGFDIPWNKCSRLPRTAFPSPPCRRETTMFARRDLGVKMALPTTHQPHLQTTSSSVYCKDSQHVLISMFCMNSSSVISIHLGISGFSRATLIVLSTDKYQSNTNVDGKQKALYALTSIKGIGPRFADLILKKADIDKSKRAGELTAEELERVVQIVKDPASYKIPAWFLNRQRDITTGQNTHAISSAVDSKLREDLERLKKIRAHRGLRHYWGLRVRGQHTKTTGRRGRTVGVSKKKG
ncbi:hypothetical protein NUW58_g5838 [Xylaria curta]|uniref:Uncharacterized protein n=1 Tax=Xylaria curta TaxID=42375 RepID=A0ACC1P2Q6_9PEZI|nr:hypothetical protein NUW58_g5838 [Xylaria curta]